MKTYSRGKNKSFKFSCFVFLISILFILPVVFSANDGVISIQPISENTGDNTNEISEGDFSTPFGIIEVIPKNFGQAIFYPQEKFTAIITLKNFSFETISFQLEIFGSQYVKLFDENGLVADKKIIDVYDFEPGQAKTIEVVFVTLVDAPEGTHYVNAKILGKSEFIGSEMTITKSPLQINYSIEKNALRYGDLNTIVLDFKNLSDENIRNISTTIKLGNAFNVDSSKSDCGKEEAIILLLEKDLSDSSVQKKFCFKALQVSGNFPIVVETVFDDELGNHSVSKEFMVNVKTDSSSFLLVAAMVLLGILGILTIKAKNDDEKIKRQFEEMKEQVE